MLSGQRGTEAAAVSPRRRQQHIELHSGAGQGQTRLSVVLEKERHYCAVVATCEGGAQPQAPLPEVWRDREAAWRAMFPTPSQLLMVMEESEEMAKELAEAVSDESRVPAQGGAYMRRASAAGCILS